MDAYLSSVGLRALPTEATAGHPSAQLAPAPSASDELLISRLQLGEQNAIAELFKRHSSAIYRLGKRMLRDSGEADDLVQEVFLYVYRKADLFDSSKGSGRSWIFQVGYTQALLRRRKLKSIGLYSSAVTEGLRVESGSEFPVEYEQSIEGLFGRNVWKKVVEELTEDQRETLRLHFFEGYTFAEIAEKLGQSYANVRNHHYRGLEKLRKHLAENALNRR